MVRDNNLSFTQSKKHQGWKSKVCLSQKDDRNNLTANLAVAKFIIKLLPELTTPDLNALLQDNKRQISQVDLFDPKLISKSELKNWHDILKKLKKLNLLNLSESHLVFEHKLFWRDVMKQVETNTPLDDKNALLEDKDLKNGILPDGGLLYLETNGQHQHSKQLLLTSEMKHQGTNYARQLAGKSKQANGNAIERMHKNIDVLRAYMSNDIVFPYVVYCWGEDFADPVVQCKILPAVQQHEFNRDYTIKYGGERIPSASVYLKPYPKPFTVQELYAIGLQVALESLIHYLINSTSKR